jgi:hypothetical protein
MALRIGGADADSYVKPLPSLESRGVTMRALPVSMATLRALVVGWAVPLTAQQGPCDQITAACKGAGFTVGGVSTGTGMHADCVVPIMQGIAQPPAATRPLPQVDPLVVAACKARDPDFGQRQVTTSAAGSRPLPVDVAPPLATRLERASRARELSIPLHVAELVARLEDRGGVVPTPDSLVLTTNYQAAPKAWQRVCRAAGIHGATIHDARHTFAVHAVEDGIPEARLQKLLGHSHAGTTRRYAMHAPEQFLDDDADRAARHMGITPPQLHIEKKP